VNINYLEFTLQDLGYYNARCFSPKLVSDYVNAVAALKINFVGINSHSLKNIRVKGGCAFISDAFINNLNIPSELSDKISVMINGSELVPKSESPITLVRIACHVHEFLNCLPEDNWLKNQHIELVTQIQSGWRINK